MKTLNDKPLHIVNNDLSSNLIKLQLLTSRLHENSSSPRFQVLLKEIQLLLKEIDEGWSFAHSKYKNATDLNHEVFLLCREYKEELKNLFVFGTIADIERRIISSYTISELTKIIYDIEQIRKRNGNPKSYFLTVVTGLK